MALLDLQGLPARRPELLQGHQAASTLTIGCGIPFSHFSLLLCTDS
jgi:SapB morphogen precursor RamS